MSPPPRLDPLSGATIGVGLEKVASFALGEIEASAAGFYQAAGGLAGLVDVDVTAVLNGDLLLFDSALCGPVGTGVPQRLRRCLPQS